MVKHLEILYSFSPWSTACWDIDPDTVGIYLPSFEICFWLIIRHLSACNRINFNSALRILVFINRVYVSEGAAGARLLHVVGRAGSPGSPWGGQCPHHPWGWPRHGAHRLAVLGSRLSAKSMKASSLDLLLLRRGPWHCLWVGCICSAQHCCDHQVWAGFGVHTDILPGGLPLMPQPEVSVRELAVFLSGTVPDSFVSETYSFVAMLLFEAEAQRADASLTTLRSPNLWYWRWGKASGAAGGLMLPVHSFWGNSCQGMGGSGGERLGSDRCLSWKITIYK